MRRALCGGAQGRKRGGRPPDRAGRNAPWPFGQLESSGGEPRARRPRQREPEGGGRDQSQLGSPALGGSGKSAGFPKSLGQRCDGSEEEQWGWGQDAETASSARMRKDIGLGSLGQASSAGRVPPVLGLRPRGPQGLAGPLSYWPVGASEPREGRVVGM